MHVIDDLRDSHRYGVVLTLVVVQFVLISSADDAKWVHIAGAFLSALIFVVTFLTSGHAPRRRHLVLTIAVAAALATISAGAVGGIVTRGVVACVSAALVLTVATAIIRGIARVPVVNRQTILGALCVYLLLGLFFAYVDTAVGAFDSSPFFSGGRSETLANFVYFSYITLATVGYGDFTPATGLGRTIAVVEALSGQLYLVTIVALVIGNLGRARHPSPS